MTHKLIKTDNYLLVVDDSGIEVGDYYWNKEYPSQVYKRHHYNTSSDYKKIIAHLPLNGSPILEGVDLLPPIEDDVEILIPFPEYHCRDGREIKTWMDGWEEGHKEGYQVAREKYKYTEKDITILRNTLVGILPTTNPTAWEIIKAIKNYTVWFDEYIQSLHQYPTEFECEMVDFTVTKEVDYSITYSEHELKPKTITTAQGVQWVGKYK